MSGSRTEPRDPALISRIEEIQRESTSVAGRHIDLPGTTNTRDVGGYPVTGGGQTRWRTLLRSDSLHKAYGGPDGALAGLGLRTVVDLRTAAETEFAPSPMDALAATGARTRHISILGEDFDAIPRDLAGVYEWVITRRGAMLGAAVSALAAPGALPALVHCTAGKDRTGLVIALTLAAIGVPDDYVAADYSMTEIYMDPLRTPVIAQLELIAGLEEEIPAGILEAPAELMLRVLDLVRDRAGSIADYLRGHGVTDDELTRLRAALVKPGAAPAGQA